MYKRQILKSFVTTSLVDRVAESYGCAIHDVLTGFKYIGEFATDLEKKNEGNRFILGMEESYGYLSGLHARDKDAVVASLLVSEMAAYYKSQGKTLAQKMTEIYENYGYYKNILLNFTFEGEKMCIRDRADILEKITDESPIILLDDVMSELDDGRQELLLERLGKRQVFITCCEDVYKSQA